MGSGTRPVQTSANLLTRYPSPDYPKKGVDVPYLPVGYLSVRWYRTFTPAARVFSSMILLISSLPRQEQQWIILEAIKTRIPPTQ